MSIVGIIILCIIVGLIGGGIGFILGVDVIIVHKPVVFIKQSKIALHLLGKKVNMEGM